MSHSEFSGKQQKYCYPKGYKTRLMRDQFLPPGIEENQTEVNMFFKLNPVGIKIQEYYLYDIQGLIGSIGGSLGLAIGFSFFDLFCGILDFVVKKISMK